MTREAPWIAAVEECDGCEADTREGAIDAALSEWSENHEYGDEDGPGPGSVTVYVYRDATICDSVDENGDCPCGEGDSHEEGRWVVSGWASCVAVEIPITYDADGYPTAHTDGGAHVPDAD